MSPIRQPTFTIIAGPNGAGKSTVSAVLVPPGVPFINADVIATQIASEVTPQVELRAGRLALERMDELAARRADFVLETTLANRSLIKRVEAMQADGYLFHLHYVWVSSVEISVARVADRVARGGHDIPEETIRRRYEAGRENFLRNYSTIADVWSLYDNSEGLDPLLVAQGGRTFWIRVFVPSIWRRFQEIENG